MSNLPATPIRLLPLAFAAISMLAAGCAVELPATSPPPRGPLPLSDVDQDVVSALVGQRLLPRQEAEPGDEPPLALISDITLRVCDFTTQDRSGVQCLGMGLVAPILQSHPEWGKDLVTLFSAQNARPRRIRLPQTERLRVVSVQDAITFVSWRRFSLTELFWLHPRGSVFYLISAPAYPSDREALVFYTSPDSHGGLVYLVREANGWAIRGQEGRLY